MRKLVPVLLFILIISSCAQVLSPNGGDKDVTPPVVLKYSPDSAATNFTGKKIVLHFNEYIQLSDLNNQLIVSPPMENQPEVTIKKKDIVIELKDSLLPNTTYTISFGKSIKDITEGNALDNFRYVFSTGSVIDSLKLAGKIVNASTLAGEKDIYVMMYTALGDSVPLKKRPYYFTKTKSDGSFEFTNLRAGKYKIFALDDKNSNYLYDNSEERIAYADQPIDLSSNIDTLNLKLFKEEPVKQKRLKSLQPSQGKFIFVYALPMHHPKLTVQTPLGKSAEVFTEYGTNGDSISVWINNLDVDSLKFQVEDSRAIIDTIQIAVNKPETKHGKGGFSAAELRNLSLTSNSSGSSVFDLGKPLVISSNNPLKNFNTADFILMKGKDTLKTDISLSENKRYLTFSYKFEEDSSYSLFVKPKAATDCFGQKNDTLKSKFKIQKADFYGTLSVKLTGLTGGNYILKLVNEKDEVQKEMTVTDLTSAKFEMLPPGTYHLKLIADENKNGKWDTGIYFQHKQPEKVIYYANPVKMRSGWDMDVEWIFK
jgi:hypothetical protein